MILCTNYQTAQALTERFHLSKLQPARVLKHYIETLELLDLEDEREMKFNSIYYDAFMADMCCS